jgi:hypothetical protein
VCGSTAFPSFIEARRAVPRWIRCHNDGRPHQVLGYLGPHQFRAMRSRSSRKEHVMDRKTLLDRLVLTRHLNVPERQALGAGHVSAVELQETIAALLSEHRYFPPDVRPWEPGNACYEGFILELLPDGHARLHC